MAMKIVTTLLTALLLTGCSDGGHEKRDGAWRYDDNKVQVAHPGTFKPLKGAFARDAQSGYYRGYAIDGSDGPTFEVIDDYYARDRQRVYFCDTYRKGQEYYTMKHNRVIALEGVDPASFKLLKERYARDNSRLYFEGVQVPVKDLNSFEILENNFQRDHVTGYYRRMPIAGSDGSTFTVINTFYTKDKASVFYSAYDADASTQPHRTVRVAGASPESFVTRGAGYAADANQVYHNGKFLTKDVANFEVLPSLYAKAGSVIYFDGEHVADADAATFAVLERREEDADARDARASYLRGVRVAVTQDKSAGKPMRTDEPRSK